MPNQENQALLADVNQEIQDIQQDGRDRGWKYWLTVSLLFGGSMGALAGILYLTNGDLDAQSDKAGASHVSEDPLAAFDGVEASDAMESTATALNPEVLFGVLVALAIIGAMYGAYKTSTSGPYRPSVSTGDRAVEMGSFADKAPALGPA